MAAATIPSPFKKTRLAMVVAGALASLAAPPIFAAPTTCPTSIANSIVNTGCELTGSSSVTVDAGGAINSSFYGIYASPAATGDITNNGTITALTYGIGIEGDASFGRIVNTGTITGGVLAGVAIAGSISSLDNTGTIDGGSGGKAIYVMSAGSHVTNGITNTGLINGSVILNDATLNLNGQAGRVTGAVSGGGSSTVNVNGTFATENTFAVGTFNIASGGVLNMAHGVTTTTGFNNSGTLAVAAGTTATITGNYTQAASGTFLSSVTDNTTYGKLVVTGTANLPSNAQINVNVANPNFSFTATRMSAVISAGTLNSDGSFDVSDNSLLFNFGAVKNGNAVDLTIAAAVPAVLTSVVNTGNSPAIGAAMVLDRTFAADPSGSLASHFISLSTERAVSNAVSETLPLLTGSSTIATQSALSGINRIIQARIEANRGMSSGETFYGDKNFWVKPFGSWADQNDRNGVSGFKANTYGFAGGFDGSLSPVLRIGGAFAYANANINSNSTIATQGADVNVYQLIGYGSYAIDDRTEINFQADVGQNSNKGRRQISFASAVASSDFNSQTAHVGLGIGRSYSLSNQTSLTPSVRADYTWIKDEAYGETGAGSLNLNVNSRTTEALVLGGDGKLAHRLNDQTTLIANLGVGYDIMNKQASITSAYAGAPGAAFVTYGLDPSPWIVQGGVGAVYKAKSGLELSARYDVEHRDSFLNQTASVKVRWAF